MAVLTIMPASSYCTRVLIMRAFDNTTIIELALHKSSHTPKHTTPKHQQMLLLLLPRVVITTTLLPRYCPSPKAHLKASRS
jgi:hypothetical protein